MTLDFLVLPTYNTLTLGIADTSTYDTNPPDVESPTYTITVPGFATMVIPFTPGEFTVYNSYTLGISALGDDLVPLPDGIYTIRCSVAPANENYVEKNIMRTDLLQEKFDEAFMTLDMIQCDRKIKQQSMEELSTVYFFIQGAIAAANSCAPVEASELYTQAEKMLTLFTTKHCCQSQYTVTYNTYGM